MSKLIRTMLVRSLLVGVAFVVTAVLMFMLDLTHERSVFDWLRVIFVLSLLSLLAAFTVTLCEGKLFDEPGK